MPPDLPRVLVTGAGGAAGVAILQAMEGAPVTMLAADIDPYASGLYLVPASERAVLPRGEGPQYAEALLEVCRRLEVDLVVPTVDTELLPLAVARSRYADAGVGLLLASEATLAVCLDKWLLAERCRDTVRVPVTSVVDESFDASAVELPVIVKPRSGSGSRGIRLIAERAQLHGLVRDGTLLVQEHLPGPEYSLDVLARADGHVAAVVPRSRLKIKSGIAVTGRTLHDPRFDAFARGVARAIGLTSVANVQVKEDSDGAPALLEVNPRFPGTMPLTVASGVDMPRLAIAEALGVAIPDGPLPFEDLAMVRFYEQRFFALEEMADLQRDAEAILS